MPPRKNAARIPEAGTQFGKLTVTGDIEFRYDQWRVRRFSRCVCSCEHKTLMWVRPAFLYNGFQSCCGCSHNAYPVAGTTHNRLTATGVWRWGKTKFANVLQWEVSCSCGSPLKFITATKVITGRIMSCGCLLQESNRRLMDPLPFWKTAVYGQVNRSSNTKSRSFTLSKDEVWELCQSPCFYCGIPPSNVMKGKCGRDPFMWNGLDRMDASKDYVHGNVVPACWPCNRAKGSLSTEQFIANARRIAEHTKNHVEHKQRRGH